MSGGARTKTSSGPLDVPYEILGKGEALLLLRGLGRSSSYWLGYEKQLAKHFRVVMVDARGIGKNKKAMRWGDSIDDLAQDCLSVMDRLKQRRFHVFGLSLGGMIGLSLARLAPDRIKTLVVANSSSADERSVRFNPLSFWLLACGAAKGRFHETLLRRTVADAVARSRGPEIVAAWRRIASEEGIPLVPMAKQLLAASRFKIGGDIDGERVPILFLCGSADQLVPRRNTLRLHQLIAGSQYKLIKGAGHEITLGHEREISRHILDFAKQNK